MCVFQFTVILIFTSLANTLHINETQVVFVNLLHRHGERTPVYFYPTDPYQNLSYWPDGLGQLTDEGKIQVYELGQWLRQRYAVLLTDRYTPDIIYVRSTDKDRTLMSAECNMAGMYPPVGDQVWDADLPWQPIPVHTMPLDIDKVLGQPPKTPCPAYSQEIERVFLSDEAVRQSNETFSDMLRWTSKNAGDNFTLWTLYNIYDTLLIESINGLALPDWTKSVFPSPMREANVFGYKLLTWTPKLARLKTGLLLQEMIQNMENKVHNMSTQRVHVYSAHDETIVHLLRAIGAFNDVIPPFAACLMMELRVDSAGRYYVTVYLRNSSSIEPYQLTPADCAPLCPLDMFINLTQPLIPQNWDLECAVSGTEPTSYLKTVLIVAAVVVLGIVVVIICCRCFGRRNSF